MFRFFNLMSFPDLALAAARGASRLDPLSFADRFNIASILLHDARYPEAVAAGKSALALRPNHSVALAIVCTAAANSGQLLLAAATDAELSQSKSSGAALSEDDTARPLCDFAIAVAQRRTSDAHGILDALVKGFPQNGIDAYTLAEKYAIAGDFNRADFWFARSYDDREFSLFVLPGDRMVPAPFRDTPNYKALLERPLFRDWQNAHDQLASDLAAR
jgi:tetratricopeptide (TPR) repeat protein